MKANKLVLILTLFVTMVIVLVHEYVTLTELFPAHLTPKFNPSDDKFEIQRKSIQADCRKDPQNASRSICDSYEYSMHKKLDSGYNEAILSQGNCVPLTSAQTKRKGSEKIILLTNFVDFRHENYRNNMGLNLDDVKFTADQPNVENALEARMFEILDALKKNLQHPMIDRMHILVAEWESVVYLRTLDLPNSRKIVLQFMNQNVTMHMQFMYSMKCLKDQIVAIVHQDNMVGEGWDHLKPDILRDNKIFYAITRHPSFKTRCFVSDGYTCIKGGGSYDTFVFHVKEELTKEKLSCWRL